MKKLIYIWAVMLGLAVSACGGESRLVVTKDVAEDATYLLYTMLVDNRDKNVTIEFEQGEYHLYPENGLEKFCYMSNHSDWLARLALPIIDREGLTIEGNGSKLIIHGRMIPIWIENSNDIVIKDLTIDFAESFHSEMRVLKSNAKQKYIDFEISPTYPYEIRNGSLIFTKRYFEHNMDFNMTFDAETYAPSFCTESLWMFTKPSVIGHRKVDVAEDITLSDDFASRRHREFTHTVTELKPGVVRVSNVKQPMTEGLILACKGENGKNRFAPGFRAANSSSVSAQNVTIHHAGGMGFLFEQCKDVELLSCNVIPSNGRYLSATADATHFNGCRGTVTIKGCTFTNQMDDGVNLHGSYQIVKDIIDSHTIGVRMGHYQQAGFQIGEAGDTIGFVCGATSIRPYHKLAVEKIDMINGRYQRIKFKTPLPKEVKIGDVIDNLSAVAEITIEDCTFKNSRAHGVLISTPLKSVVRNCYFSTQMGAIGLYANATSHWHESGEAKNLLIENNTFQDGAILKKIEPIIGIKHNGTGNKERGVFKNITIRNNTFNHYDNYILGANSVDGLIFEGNTITNSGTYPQLHPEMAAVRLEMCDNYKIENNDNRGKAPKFVEIIE